MPTGRAATGRRLAQRGQGHLRQQWLQRKEKEEDVCQPWSKSEAWGGGGELSRGRAKEKQEKNHKAHRDKGAGGRARTPKQTEAAPAHWFCQEQGEKPTADKARRNPPGGKEKESREK